MKTGWFLGFLACLAVIVVCTLYAKMDIIGYASWGWCSGLCFANAFPRG